MVIPRFLSSGALSMELYSRKSAKPFEACLLVMAAERVVYIEYWVRHISVGGIGGWQLPTFP